MTAPTSNRRLGPLALRLAAAFVTGTVAVAAVGVLAALIITAADRETDALLDRQHRDAAQAAAAVAAADAGLTLTEDLAPAPTAGDPDRLHQVVLNLLSNAVKFTPPGGTVTLRTAAVGGRAVLEVTDTGPGLPGDEAAHVFDRFWQGTAGKAAGGSGIGLAVAAELVGAHGGTLRASNADPGARFEV